MGDLVELFMDSYEARKLLFKQHLDDLRNSKVSTIENMNGVSLWILTAPEFGMNLEDRLFTPIANYPSFFFGGSVPNIREDELMIGIYFDYFDACEAFARAEEIFEDQGMDIKVMMQSVSYQQGLRAAAGSAVSACVHFGSDCKLFLPATYVAGYDYLESERQKQLGEYSQEAFELAKHLGVDVSTAEIINIRVRAYRGLVEIELNKVDAVEGVAPVLIVTAKERSDVGNAIFVDSMIEATRTDLAKQLCGPGMPFSDVFASYLPARAIPLGPGTIEF